MPRLSKLRAKVSNLLDGHFRHTLRSKRFMGHSLSKADAETLRDYIDDYQSNGAITFMRNQMVVDIFAKVGVIL